MSDSLERAVRDAVGAVVDPTFERSLASLDALVEVDVQGGSARCVIRAQTPGRVLRRKLAAAAKEAAEGVDGVTSAEIDVRVDIPSARLPSAREERLPGVRNVLAVASGKGGVGKSTVAANLAVTLAHMGARVGLLDGDIYGPSLPTMLGLRGQAPLIDETRKRILPMEAHGLRTMSMGFLLKESDAVVWRGPMLGKALQQFLDDVEWGELDYLVIDLPPGTGDVQLSLAQLIGVTGAAVVTTPQDVAHADVSRAVRMFERLEVPVLGVVENMSFFLCPDNGRSYAIFGEGRTADFAADHGLDLIAQLPIDLQVAPSGDRGIPVVEQDPGGDQGTRYAALAEDLTARMARRAHEIASQNRAQAFFNVQPG